MAATTILLLFFAIGLLIAFVVAGYFVWRARVNLRRVRQKDDSLKEASHQLSVAFWVAVISELVFIFIITVFILLSEFLVEFLLIGWVRVTLALFVLLIIGSLTLTVGIFSAIAASNIRSSSSYDPTDDNISSAYQDSIIAAVISLLAVGLLLILVVVYLITSSVKARKKKAKQKAYIETQAQLTALKLEAQTKLAKAQIEAAAVGA